MAHQTFLSFALLIILSKFSLSAFAHIEEQKLSFTAELIHRDSPISPFFNASETRSQRLIKAFQRSSNRVNNLLSNAGKSFESPLVDYNGGYLMNLKIGLPPSEILMNVASGSDFTWLPCLDNMKCTQNCTNRIFDPTKSSTYKKESCESYTCQMTTGASCEFPECVFPCDSRDGSCSKGVISTDVFMLSSIGQQPVSLPSTTFVCGNQIAGDYPGVGFLGLGKGALSFVSRIDHLIDGRFSYCLVPYDSDQPSKISFGLRAVVSGNRVVNSELQPTISPYTLYFFGFQVGSERITYMSGLYVDSGVMFTQLHRSIYSDLEHLVTTATPQEPIDADSTSGLKLCYHYTSDFNPPVIRMFFNGGPVELSTWNSFVRIDEDTVCLAFVPSESDDQNGVYGSWQQMNFLVGYDVKKATISFMKTDCTQYV